VGTGALVGGVVTLVGLWLVGGSLWEWLNPSRDLQVVLAFRPSRDFPVGHALLPAGVGLPLLLGLALKGLRRAQRGTTRRAIEQAVGLISVCLFAWLAYEAAYELFVFEPGVHYPRIVLGPGAEASGRGWIRLSLNTPTVTSLVSLAVAWQGMGAACAAWILAVLDPTRTTRPLWLAQGLALGVYATSTLVMLADFVSTAFSGVG